MLSHLAPTAMPEVFPGRNGRTLCYVALGLMLVGAGLGAIAGLVVGIIYGVRLIRRANG
jgi:hypothetical protein